MAKGRKTAALLGVLGAGLAASKLGNVSLGQLDPDRADVIDEAKRKYGFKGALEYFDNPYRKVTDAEREQARRRAFKDSPTTVLTASGLPIETAGGYLKTYKKGGVTRADGCITKGHTRGKMV